LPRQLYVDFRLWNKGDTDRNSCGRLQLCGMDRRLFGECRLQRRYERRQDGRRNFFRQFVPTDGHCNGIWNYHEHSGWN
jgi:hypothetical protein